VAATTGRAHVFAEPRRGSLAEDGEYRELCEFAVEQGARYVLMNPLSSMGRGVRAQAKLASAAEHICQLNAGADQPELAVILNADPPTIAARLAARGRHSRFERLPDSSRTESDLYHDTAARLAAAGWPVHVHDATTTTPQQLAATVTGRILTLRATTSRSRHDQQWTGPADLQHRQPVP
jgi:hypothetical protein